MANVALDTDLKTLLYCGKFLKVMDIRLDEKSSTF